MVDSTQNIVNPRSDEERFRILVEQVSDWIWEVDQYGIYTYASPKIYDILGYLPSEVIGKTPFDLMEPEEANRIAPIFEYHVANKLPISSLENINLHRDGHEVVLETSGSPIIDDNGNCVGYRGMDRDITIRKQNERKQQQLLEIIEASPDFIATFDVNGKSLYYNPAARKMLGIYEEDHNSHSVTDWWLTDLPKTEAIPTAIEKGHWKGETSISKQDGTKIPVSQMIVAHKSENGTVEFLSTIAHDITERKELEKVVYTQAHYDALTNLPNRRYLHKKLTQLMEPTGNKRFAIIFMDLDNFKDINDNLGHDSGDHLLKMIATKLEACVEDNDFVCRYGGDEFIILLEIAHDNFKIKKIEQQIIKLFQQPFLIGRNTLKVTGSMGISIFPDDGTDLDKLLKKADTAMYKIKKDGKKNKDN